MNQCVQAAALGEVFGETTIAETTRFGMMEESKEQLKGYIAGPRTAVAT
jgi:hypothetical protein